MPAPRITLSILGPWSFCVDGRALPRPSTVKAQSSLAYLILHGTVAHPREKLAGLFWPDAGDERAQRSLRTALWSLRRLLTIAHPSLAEALQATRFDVRWAPQQPVEVDAVLFEQSLARWRRSHDADPPAALEALQTAIALYRGPLLEGLYDDWCQEERYRLEELYLAALEASVAALEQSGRLRDAVASAQRLLVIDPLREEVHRTIIRLLGILGDRAGVQRQYRRCTEILDRELAEPPSQETEQTLAEALRVLQTQRDRPRDASSQTGMDDEPAPAGDRLPLPAPAAAGRVETPPPVPAYAGDERLPLVGRDTQWQALIALLARAEAGRGQTVLVSGEAGSGKTRLLEEVAAQSRRQGMIVLWGSCYEYERLLPYQPFAEALRNSLDLAKLPRADAGEASPQSGTRSPAEALATLPPAWQQAVLLLLPEWTGRLPDASASAGDLGQDQAVLLEAVGQFLCALADRQPLLLVVDDLHWAAPSTLQLFHHLARAIRRHPMLLAGCYRPEDLALVSGQQAPSDAQPGLSVAGLQRTLVKDGLLQHIALDRLGLEQVAQLVRTAVRPAGIADADEQAGGDRHDVAALAERLYAFTEGSPLYLAAAIQSLRENGAWADQPAGGPSQLPARIRDFVQERLERVSPVTRDAACVAAVAGHEFDLAVLQQAWGKNEDETLQAVDDLLAVRLIKETAARGARDFAFSHHLLQESLYARLARPVRARLHRKVAAAIEGLNERRLVASELAYHYEHGGLLVQAAQCARVAGVQAAASFANLDAERLFTRALGLLDRRASDAAERQPDAGERFDLLAERLVVRRRIGMPDQEAADIQQMLSLARSLRDDARQSLSLLESSALDVRAGRYAGALEHAEQAHGLARGLLDRSARDPACILLAARASMYLGTAEFRLDVYDRAMAAFEQALAMYRGLAGSDSPLEPHLRLTAIRGEAAVLDRMGRLRQHLGEFSSARRYHGDALALCRESGDVSGEASALNNLGSACWFAENLHEAQSYWEAALALERRSGHRHGSAKRLRNLALISWRQGDFEHALDLLTEALAIFQDLQNPDGSLECYHSIGDVRYLVGPLEAALSGYEQALALARTVGSSHRVAQSLYGCARVDRALGRAERALARIAEARDLCRTIGYPRGIAWCDREEGLARLDLDGAAAARDLLRAAVDGFESLGEPGIVAATRAELAAAYLALDDLAAAQREAESAGIMARAHRHGVDQPQAIFFTLHRILLVSGDRSAADGALAEAMREIDAQAGRLRDPGLQASFRQAVPINRAILAAARSVRRRPGDYSDSTVRRDSER